MQIHVTDPSAVGEARRKIVAFAQEIGLDENRLGAVALATTEMASNLVKHVGQGYLLVHRISERDGAGMRIISVDRGPGIADLARALTDGHSSAGSMGFGLGSIKRLANTFEVYSMPGSGVIIGIEFWRSQNSRRAASPIELGVVAEPLLGETVSGDGWRVVSSEGEITAMLVDGLGHGAVAAEAAQEAERILSAVKDTPLSQIISDAHSALRKTRGAAVALARIDVNRGLLTFAGVGNISAVLLTPSGSRGLTSHNGTVGQNVARVQEFTYPWSADSILILHSDGLTTRWDLGRYPGLLAKDTSLIAALLHRDFYRGRDDVTILVARSRRRETDCHAP